MKAVVARKGEENPEVIEKPKPEPEEGEALIRILRVGIDGTDHEVLSGGHGGFPEGEDHMVLGHEAVGVVEKGSGDFEEGDIVTPTVRRPPQEDGNKYFERGEPDMAPEGYFHECGIFHRHGYMQEYITVEPQYLVRVPEEIAEHGFLIEPLSNTEKAIDLARDSRSGFTWEPDSFLVLGNGSLGLISLASRIEEFENCYCLGRRDRPDPTIDIIEKLDAIYIDSRETSLSEIPESYQPMDLIVEATGYAPHAFNSIPALAPNGVAALLGIPGEHDFEIEGGDLHKNMVMENKAVVGSVNSFKPHFREARENIKQLPNWFFEDFITGVYTTDELDEAFTDDKETIKNVIEFDTL